MADWSDEDYDLATVDWDAVEKQHVKHSVILSTGIEKPQAHTAQLPSHPQPPLPVRNIFMDARTTHRAGPADQFPHNSTRQQEVPQVYVPPTAFHPQPQPVICTIFATLQLGVGQRIEINMGWHAAAHAALKSLPSGEWEPKRRCWTFPIQQHDLIVDTLKAVQGVRMRVEPLAGIASSVLAAGTRVVNDSSRYCHIPTSLEEQLMAFQREGVKFGLEHGGRVLIGDEMGLGKTVQALALLAAYRDEWPALIITPSSLREQWADALHRWLGITEDLIHVVHNGKDASHVPSGAQFLIVSYNFVPKMEVVLQRFTGCVVLDESHYIKDNSAQRTKATVPVVKRCRRAFLLTGTPALNRPKEIFTQLSALLPDAKLKMKDFGERYCQGNRFDKYGGASNLEELHALLRGTVMVRRLKAQVLSQLPRKRRQQVFLTLDNDSKKELAVLSNQLEGVKQALAQLTKMNEASSGAVSLGGGRMEENKVIMELYRRTAELKTRAVQDYIQTLLDAGQKFLVFAHHTVLMDAIEHTCNRHRGCKFIRIDGKTPPESRQRLVNSFQENEDVKVAILSIRAAGVGITLTAASTVVFAEMTWTPGELHQAEDRVHRIGQASAVNVYFLHVRNSIDEIIWQSIQNKLENLGQTLDGEEKSMEVNGVRFMPEHGQASLDGFLHVPPPPSAQRPPQPAGPGSMIYQEATHAAVQEKQQDRHAENEIKFQQTSIQRYLPGTVGGQALHQSNQPLSIGIKRPFGA